MYRSGIAKLPLHYGRCPRWLFRKIRRLAVAISEVIIDEHGTDEFLRRLASPYWFQAFGCVLAFDWHSSGLTTTVLGGLKEALRDANLQIMVAGGKGKASLKTPLELVYIGEQLNFNDKTIRLLQRSSKLAAKVDNALLQDGHQLYHHCIIVSAKKKWVVVQQGMNVSDGTARRYHWLGEHVKTFVEEPHEGIISERKYKNVLDLSSKRSKETRKLSVDLAKEKPKALPKLIESARKKSKMRLRIKGLRKREQVSESEILEMPRRLNWAAIERAYELQPRNYEELLMIKGIGPAALRALALISNLIYGTDISWSDPAIFSFAHGGKDGVPYPVNRNIYESSIRILEQAIKEARLGERDKLKAIKRLRHAYAKVE